MWFLPFRQGCQGSIRGRKEGEDKDMVWWDFESPGEAQPQSEAEELC